MRPSNVVMLDVLPDEAQEVALVQDSLTPLNLSLLAGPD
jgi:hypothetical protein